MARECASLTEGKVFARRLREVIEKRGENASTLSAKIKDRATRTRSGSRRSARRLTYLRTIFSASRIKRLRT